MAEATEFRNNALPYPVYGLPWTVVFPALDNDGDPVTAIASPDSEISKNGDDFADCADEVTEIATGSGVYFLTLTGAEMTADIVAVQVRSASCKTMVLTFYPRKLVALRSNTAQGGAAGYITLDASAGAQDDRWNGCVVVATIDTTNIEVRTITDYTGSNQQAAVVPDWNITPDSDDTFVIYLPEGRQLPDVNVFTIAQATAAVPGASGGILISGSNAGTTTLGALTVTGNTTLTGAVAFGSTLNVNSAVTLNSLTVTNATTLSGAVSLGSTLGIAALTTMHSLTVTNNVIITGTTTHTGHSTYSDGIGITAPTTADRHGLSILGNGAGHGISIVAGATGTGFRTRGGATSGSGISAAATGLGHGIDTAGVGTSQHGINATGGATTGNGIRSTGGGSGAGLHTVGGATGNGFTAAGGATSGHGIGITTVSGDGINSAPTSGHGLLLLAAGTAKHGIFSTGASAGQSDGFRSVAGGTGVDFRGNITGDITGTLSDINLAIAVPTSNVDNTLGDCLNLARGQGGGKWTVIDDVLAIYAPNESTVIASFNLTRDVNQNLTGRDPIGA